MVADAADMSITTSVTVIVYVTALALLVPSPTVIVYTYTPLESASVWVSKSGDASQLTVSVLPEIAQENLDASAPPSAQARVPEVSVSVIVNESTAVVAPSA